jgi:hypothetical protein
MKNIRCANELLGMSVGDTFSMLIQTDEGPRSSEPLIVEGINFKGISIEISCRSHTDETEWTMLFPFTPANLRSDS